MIKKRKNNDAMMKNIMILVNMNMVHNDTYNDIIVAPLAAAPRPSLPFLKWFPQRTQCNQPLNLFPKFQVNSSPRNKKNGILHF